MILYFKLLFRHLFEFIYIAHFHPELGGHFVQNIHLASSLGVSAESVSAFLPYM